LFCTGEGGKKRKKEVAAGVHHQPFFPFFIKFVVAHTFLLLFLVYGCDARTRRGHAAAPTTATAGQRGRGEGGWEERSCVVVLWLSQQPSHARKKRAESWRARKKKTRRGVPSHLHLATDGGPSAQKHTQSAEKGTTAGAAAAQSEPPRLCTGFVFGDRFMHQFRYLRMVMVWTWPRAP
jgi:hypothetical protein